MVNAVRLTPAQRQLRVDSDDERDFRLAAVLRGNSTIDRGDDGAGVRFVQRLLREFGHDVKTDGDFGPNTQAAVERFQRNHGLGADGVVGDKTLRKLLARNPADEARLLKLGQSGKAVTAMETNLHRLGYLDRDEVGGKYDADTAKALRQFRRDQPELKDNVTGNNAGSPAQESLAREVRELRHNPFHGRVRRTEARVDTDQKTALAARDGIARGDDRAPIVANVQRHLKAAGYDPQNTRGNFDERTEASLRQFQRKSGLPATGAVDPETWRKLRGSIVLAKDGTSPPQRIGERSGAVLRSEKLLDKAGFDPGKVDGVFDRGTMRALERFEHAHPRAGNANTIGDRQIKHIEREARRANELVKPIDHRLTSLSEFGVQDAEGAPANDGRRYHAGKDWFAPGGSRVRAPVDGRIVEVKASQGNSGQVFGGTVKVQDADGKVWVFRHVDPANVRVGQRVDAGDTVARVTRWAGGPSHAHIELWKSLGGGYDFENMIDPMKYLKRFL